MEITSTTDLIRRVRVALWLNLLICIWALTVFIKALNGNTMWRTVSSGIGFVGFLAVCVLLVLRLKKLQRQLK
ncbi:hypothetical protein [uncultured Mucilaginibacter sp.]|uniref:hypothetical protein n=1 Tax=uncultured Mucilaginibacter sp. TaxID=797541 RepID=UPI0025E2E0DF|nr:hypothetical protein [uncultured Mucilaginibacter sp.]